MRRKYIITGLLTLLAGAGSAGAAVRATPLQLSLFHPNQLFPASANVYGLRLNLAYGLNRDLYGLDVGGINRATGDVVGVQAAALWNGAGRLGGLQISPGLNYARERRLGMQGGLINYFRPPLTDFNSEQFKSEGDTLLGLQAGFFNYAAAARMHGAQIGVVNSSRSSVGMHGIQAGFIGNLADNVRGVQLSGTVLGVNACANRLFGVQLAYGLFAWNECGGVMLGGGEAVDGFGVQAALGVLTYNVCGGRFEGVQISGLFGANNAYEMSGIQLALLNYATRLQGIQVGGLANGVPLQTGPWRVLEMRGIQAAIVYNGAGDMRGVQGGLVNSARTRHGVQRGLVTVIAESPVPVLPICNLMF